MALKKTVKKRRRAKRKVVSIETITEALQAEISLSSYNKRALSRLSTAEKAVERLDKKVEIASEKVTKARATVANAKTPASTEKAKDRLAGFQASLKEAKAERAAAITEQRKSLRLAKGLYTAMKKSQTKMVKEYEKAAKILEKTSNKTTRRRRRSKKKAVAPE
jgi:ribosomal protein S12 methylthiotransferase accessory factor YcaO